jgi:hypothetical protein
LRSRDPTNPLCTDRSTAARADRHSCTARRRVLAPYVLSRFRFRFTQLPLLIVIVMLRTTIWSVSGGAGDERARIDERRKQRQTHRVVAQQRIFYFLFTKNEFLIFFVCSFDVSRCGLFFM